MTEPSKTSTLAALVIKLVRELSQARRELDLAIECLVNQVRAMGQLERTLNETRERHYLLLDERREAREAARPKADS